MDTVEKLPEPLICLYFGVGINCGLQPKTSTPLWENDLFPYIFAQRGQDSCLSGLYELHIFSINSGFSGEKGWIVAC